MIDVQPSELAIIVTILTREAPDCVAFAFGSRVTGTAKPWSDLDILLKGPQALPLVRFGEILEAFQESELPFRVDLVDWYRAGSGFRTIIESQLVVLKG